MRRYLSFFLTIDLLFLIITCKQNVARTEKTIQPEEATVPRKKIR